MPDLLPCPFCGGEAKFSYQPGQPFYNSYVYCKECFASSGEAYADEKNKDEVIKRVCEAWNRRVPTVAPIHKSINEQSALSPVHKSINERKSNAGRKTILNRNIYHRIMMYHKGGSSVRQIVQYINTFEGEKVSVGFVHKVIKMPAPTQLLDDQLTLDELRERKC
jgi:hypothetical protein